MIGIQKYQKSYEHHLPYTNSYLKILVFSYLSISQMQISIELTENIFFPVSTDFLLFQEKNFVIACCTEGNIGECTASWQMVLKLGRFFCDTAVYQDRVRTEMPGTGHGAQQGCSVENCLPISKVIQTLFPVPLVCFPYSI